MKNQECKSPGAKNEECKGKSAKVKVQKRAQETKPKRQRVPTGNSKMQVRKPKKCVHSTVTIHYSLISNHSCSLVR